MVKIATSSTSFDRMLTSGDITQLEWLDWCASIPIDGVVFNVRHFPRVDPEYLAQLKKLAADLGLSVAAVRSDGIFEAWEDALRIASTLGAPVVLTRTAPAQDDAQAWNSLVAGAQAACARAKEVNVPIAVGMRDDTLTPDASALKRLAKDVDSSWLRFAIDPGTPSAVDPLAGILARSVIAAHETVDLDPFGADVVADISGALRGLASFRGFFVLDYIGDGNIRESVLTHVTWLRTMLAKETLDQHA